jgi:hypothetical protein
MANVQRLTIPVSEEIGPVSGLLLLPPDATALLVLSHGAGAGMEHAFMEMLAQRLAEHQVGTLRFNFAYMEKGGGAPDRPPKAQQVIKATIKEAEKYADRRTLLAGGKSFGGRMTSHLAANGEAGPVRGIVYYGFPLHPAGKPGTERAAHLSKITLPQLFLQGTRDTLAQFDLIEAVCKTLPNAQLVKLESADHSFKTLKRSGVSHEEMVEKLAVATAEFASRR